MAISAPHLTKGEKNLYPLIQNQKTAYYSEKIKFQEYCSKITQKLSNNTFQRGNYLEKSSRGQGIVAVFAIAAHLHHAPVF